MSYYLLTVSGTLAMTFDILCHMKIFKFLQIFVLLHGPFSKRRNRSKIWTLLEKEKPVKDMDPSQKREIGRIYRLSSERKNKSKIWNFFGKEDQVEDMDSPRKGRIG